MSGTVLIADRVATNRIVLRSMVASLFEQVIMADSGAAAVDCLVEEAPDVAIISGDLDDWDFAELLARMRVMAPGMRILSLVPNTLPVRMAAFDAGADDVMALPLDQALLQARVRRLLRAKGPVQAMSRGLAEPLAGFAGLLPVSLIAPPSVAREQLVSQLRRQGITVARQAAAGRATLLWGQDGADTRAEGVIDAAHAPVVCVLPGVSPAREISLLDHGAADVLSQGDALPELRARLMRVLPLAA